MPKHPTPAGSREVAAGLTGLLADTYVLFNTTQFYHWNVEGPSFRALHSMFAEQYRELAAAVDLLAERVRALGFYTPGTLAAFVRVSRLDQDENVRDPEKMLDHLIRGHRQVIHRLRDLQNVVESTVDDATGDLLVQRLRVHETTVWQLTSQAGGRSESLEATEARTGVSAA